MSVILAMRARLAGAIRGRLGGSIYEHHKAQLSRVPDDNVPEEGPAQLVRLVTRVKPLAIALDVTLGGQRYMAMDAVRAILSGAESAKRVDLPAIVVLVPRMTLAFARDAWDLGVFSAVEISDRDPKELARPIADEICRAIAWRDGLSVQRLPWLSDLEAARQPMRASSDRPQRRRRANA
jgi:hypothetical protein